MSTVMIDGEEHEETCGETYDHDITTEPDALRICRNCGAEFILDRQPREGQPTVTIECHIEMSAIAGSGQNERIEVDREWWESLTENEQEQELRDYADGFMENTISYGAHVMSDGG